MSDNNIELLKALKVKALGREILTKTQKCALTWSQISTTQFQTTSNDSTNHWKFTVSKTQSNSENYTLDILLNESPYLSVINDDDDIIKELYDVIYSNVIGDLKKIDFLSEYIQTLETSCD